MDKNRKKAQTVTAMSDYIPHRVYAAVSQVEAYWDALRDTRDMPRRSDIDPRGIEKALEHAFILERVAAGVARLRIAGSHLSDVMGMEVRGMPLTAFFEETDQRQMAQVLEEVFQGPAKAMVEIKTPSYATDAGSAGRMILLPLQSDLGDVSRILGCFVYPGDLENAPIRFTVSDVKLTGIGKRQAGGAPRAPMREAEPQQTDTPRGFEEPRADFARKPGDKRPSYLKLVKSDRD